MGGMDIYTQKKSYSPQVSGPLRARGLSICFNGYPRGYPCRIWKGAVSGRLSGNQEGIAVIPSSHPRDI